MKGIWITWEHQRRNGGLSSSLEFALFEVVTKKNRIFRYIQNSFRTIRILIREKPDIVCVQNPSIVLSFLVVVIKKFLTYKVLIDTHNAGICPLEGRSKTLMLVTKWLQRHTDLTIVTNQELKSLIESNGGRAFALPDKIPEPPTSDQVALEGRKNVVFICTFAEDEPYIETFRAAELLPDDVVIYVTGDYKGKYNPDQNIRNLRFLGFVPESHYWALLNSADAVIDLTLRENCLVCGAYEAVSLCKPAILSRTNAIMSYFSRGCIYVEPDSAEIALAVNVVLQRSAELRLELKDLKLSMQENWVQRIEELKTKLLNL